MSAGIYLITVKPTKETYVGSSINIEKRRRSHWSILRRCFREKRVCESISAKGGGIYTTAIQYDPDMDFEFQVLEELPSIGCILAERERYWAEKLNPALNIRKKISRRDQSI